MENKKSKVEDLVKFAENGVITIKHLSGPAEKFLDPVAPILPMSADLTGRVGTIAGYLSKRAHQFKDDTCNILVNLNENVMQFTGNERCEDGKLTTCIESNIIETKHYKALEVGTEREFKALELANYLRKRKNMFVNPEQFNDVFTALSSFTAAIEKQIETVDKKDGNAVNSVRQKVTHNMPRHFDLRVPIFEGAEPVLIEIEIDVNPNDLRCSLMSFDLEQKYDDLKESLFEGELDQVIKLPSLPEDEAPSNEIKLRDFCVVYYS